MKNYLKLVNFEFNRFFKVFLVLLVITLVAQITGVIVASKNYLKTANEAMYQDMISKAEFLAQYGQMSFLDVTRTLWFLGPIALCAAAVAFYIFLIWYRDWFGKNTFIYRLLMLPTNRLNVFFAKITTILLATLGFVAFQLLLLPVEMTILKWMVPRGFRIDMNINELISSLPELTMIIPNSILGLILYYGAGIMVVSVLFTGILLERSFRWKGFFAGLIYSMLAIVVIFAPLFIQEFLLNDFFYPLELFLIEIAIGMVVLAISIWMSGFLLKKKITV
ncbi:hypothetical protein VBD025_02295 [Virgibacillus flavescens]|uniref:hypothetical protein n=1 Tax=Virgibacillus flavescens TaxID=1611422 RepID=UPI003D34F249